MDTELVERREEEGGAVELWRRGADYDVLVEGRPVISTDAPRTERSLAELALAPWQGRDDLTVLIAGLGSGRLARAFLSSTAVRRVDIVEISQAIIDWEARYFAPGPEKGITIDPRVHLHHAEVGAFLRAPAGGPEGGWLVAAMDLDELPYSLSRPDNLGLYDEAGLALLEGALRPGGVLALWLTDKDEELHRRMAARFQNVMRVGIPVEVRGHSHLDYVYRGRRGAQSSGGMMN